MGFQKKHAIRDLNSTTAAQDIDDNFDSIYAALRALQLRLNSVNIEGGEDGKDGLTVIIPGEEGPPGEDGSPGPPGIRGADGAAGATGAAGPPFAAFYNIDVDQPEEVLPIPGPTGATGATGSTGAAGPPTLGPMYVDETYLEESFTQIFNTTSTGGGGGWTLIESRTCTGNAVEDFTNLSSYNELAIFLAAVTTSSLALRILRVSNDNGSTFFTTSGDYANITTGAALTNQSAINFHATTASSARTCFIILSNFNDDTPKWARSIDNLVNYTIPAVAALACDAIRVTATAGNLTGGTIHVYGR